MTPQQVVFWLNMMKVEKLIWAGYVPGTIPDNISSISTSGNTLTIQLTGPANANWFTYNELSQITPMPMAWDISANGQKAGSEACGTASFASVTTTTTKDSKGNTVVTPVSAAAKSCAAVYTYLDAQSKKISSYAGSPLWSVVNGPWKLKTIDTNGKVTFVPNYEVLRPGQADARQLRRAALHVRFGRVQRARGERGRRGVSPVAGRHLTGDRG